MSIYGSIYSYGDEFKNDVYIHTTKHKCDDCNVCYDNFDEYYEHTFECEYKDKFKCRKGYTFKDEHESYYDDRYIKNELKDYISKYQENDEL